jgi:hypothetical protein
VLLHTLKDGVAEYGLLVLRKPDVSESHRVSQARKLHDVATQETALFIVTAVRTRFQRSLISIYIDIHIQ